MVKGAPQAVLALMSAAPDASEAIDGWRRRERAVLAVADGNSRMNLRLAGLIALEDPPRPDSAALVKGLRDLGIRVVMVTGDNAATARVLPSGLVSMVQLRLPARWTTSTVSAR